MAIAVVQSFFLVALAVFPVLLEGIFAVREAIAGVRKWVSAMLAVFTVMLAPITVA